MANALKGLVFAPLPKVSASDPVVQRRNQLITRLQHQIQLANDPNYKIPRQKWVGGENGKELQDVPKKVTPWWRTASNGDLLFIVRYGAKPIFIEKGKAAIVVGKKEKLVPTILTVVAAAEAGEFDQMLSEMKASATTKGKKAA